jgi:methylated-DNA-[protein]-cysteine S-methyltransferase
MHSDDRRVASERYTLFGTAIGVCGVAWTDRGLARVQLPERDPQATERRLTAGSTVARAQAMPERVARAIGSLQAHFEGLAVDLSDIDLDLSRVAPFHRKVYAATRGIGRGRTATYGELASRVGAPGAARAVGQVMARNPVPIIVPCHRVLASGSKVGGFSAHGGTITKQRLLALEGIDLRTAAPRLPL